MFVVVDPHQHRHVVRALRHHRDARCTATSCRSSWGYFRPTLVDICTFIGTLGLFFTLFLLFIRWLPDDRDGRGEGRAARGRPALSPEATRTEGTSRARRPPPRGRSFPKGPSDGDQSNIRREVGARARAHPRRVRHRRTTSCTPPRRCATRATRDGTRTRRSRSTAWTRRWGFGLEARLDRPRVRADRPHGAPS